MSGGPNNRSYLGEEFVNLRTNSYGPGMTSASRTAPSTNTAPIAPTDVPKILEVLMPCPVGPYALRVFQQHGSVGTCWQDSMFIMLFNADWFKPILGEHVQFYMDRFFANGDTDLVYAKPPTEVEVDDYNADPEFNNAGVFKGYKKKKQLEVNRTSKIKPIAVAFRERYNLGLPLAFWEYYCLNLHRYILLGYLFYKYPDMTPELQSARKPSNLTRRRGSIAGKNYSILHKNFKGVVFRHPEIGICPRSIQQFRTWFTEFISKLSNGNFTLKSFNEKSISASEIEGYYFGLYGTKGEKHVLSLFICEGTWFLYDIDVGCIPLSAEDGAKLKASRIKSFKSEATKTGQYSYLLTLENGSTVSVLMPFNKGDGSGSSTNLGPSYSTIIGNEQYGPHNTVKPVSLVLVRVPPAAPAAAPAPAAANSNGGAAAQGGHRKTRKRRQSRKRKY